MVDLVFLRTRLSAFLGCVVLFFLRATKAERSIELAKRGPTHSFFLPTVQSAYDMLVCCMWDKID